MKLEKKEYVWKCFAIWEILMSLDFIGIVLLYISMGLKVCAMTDQLIGWIIM